MKTALRMAVSTAVVIVAVGMAPVLTGCQSPGSKSASAGTDVCPMCSGATLAKAAGDVTYEKCVCPSCKTVSTIDPNAPASMQDYIDPRDQTVQVCDGCEALVSNCPHCRGG